MGIPTTRALAAVATGEVVYRERPLPGAILTRVAASHVRVGTFQYLAARGDSNGVRCLADYVIERHFPGFESGGAALFAAAALRRARQAQLVASWMHVGFIHGVMNTDNMAVSGETIDFGPCAFMDSYDPATVFSSIDGMGRYAYANQPAAAQWNLARFAETLLPLIDPDESRAVKSASEVDWRLLAAVYGVHWLSGMRNKLGLLTSEPGDAELIQEWLELMHRNQCDYTLGFRRLCDAAKANENAGTELRALVFSQPREFEEWVEQMAATLGTRAADAP